MLYFWETGEMGWGSSSLRWPTRFLEDPADNGPSLSLSPTDLIRQVWGAIFNKHP